MSNVKYAPQLSHYSYKSGNVTPTRISQPLLMQRVGPRAVKRKVLNQPAAHSINIPL